MRGHNGKCIWLLPHKMAIRHRAVFTGRAGRERTRCGDTGAHGIVASMAAAAIDGLVFATPLRSG